MIKSWLLNESKLFEPSTHRKNLLGAFKSYVFKVKEGRRGFVFVVINILLTR